MDLIPGVKNAGARIARKGKETKMPEPQTKYKVLLAAKNGPISP